MQRQATSTANNTTHAIVIGGSIAGLLAARVLSDSFTTVTIIERDPLPADAETRKGTPQSRHGHGLLAGGYQIIERLLPGFIRFWLISVFPYPCKLAFILAWQR